MNQAVRLRVNNEIPAYRTGLVSALDVGTSKIVCVIGRAEAGSLQVAGLAARAGHQGYRERVARGQHDREQRGASEERE